VSVALVVVGVVLLLVVLFLVNAIKVVREYERAIVFRLGRLYRWTRTWFHDQGLHQLMGTIRYPKAA